MNKARANRLAKRLVGKHVGVWRLEEKIGSGKSAVVFRATTDNRNAALKIFDPELIERFGEDQKSRINRELDLTGLRHENLIRILDGGECKKTGYLFIVMEYVDAPSLASKITKVPRESIWPIISQVASAAKFLEKKGLAHRDIKPANIVISSNYKKAILLDLGVIRPVGVDGLTDGERLTFLGTARYSSPEFLWRKEEDSPEGWRAVTFYQLGAVLHDLIMRKPLFGTISPPARLHQAVFEEKPTVQAVDVSPDLVLLCKACLAKRPKTRLKAVSWNSFRARTAPPIDQAKRRIAKRMVVAKEAEKAEGSDSKHKAERMRELEKLMRSVADMIRKECDGNELLPQREVYEHTDSQFETASILVGFCASPNHDLPLPLWLCFKLNLLQQEPEFFQIKCSALVSDLTYSKLVNKCLSEESRLQTLYAGPFEESCVQRALDASIYLSIDTAQDMDASRSDGSTMGVTWLEVQFNSKGV